MEAVLSRRMVSALHLIHEDLVTMATTMDKNLVTLLACDSASAPHFHS
jgi:hypothetical protein